MRITAADGRVFEGTALQIVRAMQDVAFGQEQATVSEYVQWVAGNISRAHEIELKVTGDSDEAVAKSLLSELVRAGFAR